MRKTILRLTLLAVVVVFAVTACGPKVTAVPTAVVTAPPVTVPTVAPPPVPTETTAPPAGFTIPEIVAGKFNVGVVLIGFHADGGWSQAHTEGAQWMMTQDPNINVQYVELVNPVRMPSPLCARWLARVLT